MCEITGHRPFWGRFPATSLNFKHNLLRQGTGSADHLTLLQLFGIGFSHLVGLFHHPTALILSNLYIDLRKAEFSPLK